MKESLVVRRFIPVPRERVEVTIEFLERPGGTELVLTHRRRPPAQLESHRGGWSSIFLGLQERLMQQG